MKIAFAAALVIALTIACNERDDVAIRYLRSDDYTFSRADRRVIDEIAASTATEVRQLLPSLPMPIELFVRPGADVMTETGASATVMPPAAVMWTVDPARTGGVQKVARSWLRQTLFHEFHHLVRSASGSPRSIVERAVFEGMATVFERDFGTIKPPWGDYPDNVSAWATEVASLPDDAPERTWLFTHPDGRRWIGYKVGAYWVDRAAAASGRSAASLVTTPASEVVLLAR